MVAACLHSGPACDAHKHVLSRTRVAEAGSARAQIIEDAAVHDQYCRVITPEPAINEETEDVCQDLQGCLDLR